MQTSSLHENRYWQATPIQGQVAKVDIQVAPVSPDHIGFDRVPHLQAGFAYSSIFEDIAEKWEFARAVPPPQDNERE